MRGAEGQLRDVAHVSRPHTSARNVTVPCRPQKCSAPADTCGSVVLVARSLSDNEICGVFKYVGGTYTTEGITALCEGLKGSAVTSLECALLPQICTLTARSVSPR